MAQIIADQITITDVTDGFSVSVVPAAITLSGGVSSLGSQQVRVINISANQGGTAIEPTVGTPVCPTNVSASVGSAVNNVVPVTITFAAALSTASGQISIPVTIVGSDTVIMNQIVPFSIAFTGATGAAAYSYDLIVSQAAIAKSTNGVYTPSSITLSATRSQGSGSPSIYPGRFKIESTTDGSTWTQVFPSSGTGSDASTITYPSSGRTFDDDIIALRCSLYMAGGMTTLLDYQTVPIVFDGVKGDTGATGASGATGAAGANGADGYTILLENENHTFAAGVSAALGGSTDCPVKAWKGGSQIAVHIGSITGAPTGMTTTISNNDSTSAKFTVTVTSSMTTQQGVLTVPLTIDGKSFTKTFSYSLAPTGDTGAPGAPGADGADGADAYWWEIISNGPRTFKNATGNPITLTLLGWLGGNALSAADILSLGTVQWYKDGVAISGETGISCAVAPSDVQNSALYEVRIDDGRA